MSTGPSQKSRHGREQGCGYKRGGERVRRHQLGSPAVSGFDPIWHRLPIHESCPGTSIRQGDISGFNARLRDELLNGTAFSSLAEARIRWPVGGATTMPTDPLKARLADVIRVRRLLRSGQATAPGRRVTGVRAHRSCINRPIRAILTPRLYKQLDRRRGSHQAMRPLSRRIVSLFSPDCCLKIDHFWDRSLRKPSRIRLRQ